MNLSHTLVLVSLLAILFSCKDDCDDTICYNGGVCIDGSCDCPPGFFGEDCSSTTPVNCDEVICYNGGYCVSGTCVCPEGYTGTNCENLDLNLVLTIHSLVINNYPITDGGTPWDDPFLGASTSADVFWEINGPGQNDAESSFYYPNVSGESLLFDAFGLPFSIQTNNLNDLYSIIIWDKDNTGTSDAGSSDDVMFSVNFTPENIITNPDFPTSITLSHFSGATITLNVSYQW